MKSLEGTKTEQNLLKAFAGESQARMRYDYFVFEKDDIVIWKCRNCGYIHEAKKAPEKCPACLHPQAYFETAE